MASINKINRLNRLKKELIKGFLRIYFFFEVKFLKIKFLTLSKNKNSIKINKISILCPTKNRALKFNRMIQSLLSKTFLFERIELLICFDQNESELSNYNQILAELKKKKISIRKYFINLNSHAKRNNYLAKKCTGDLIFPINDDMIFLTKNWDKIIDYEFSKNSNLKPLCLWINCDRKYKNLDYSAFPIINRAWYRTLDYIVPEIFNFWYLDWWICEISRLSKRYFLSNVSIKQYHVNSFPNEIDKTHKLNFTKKNAFYDGKTWYKTKSMRISDSFKIISNSK